jgi:beta-glucosidase
MTSTDTTNAVYRNPQASVEERVEDLLTHMTLIEKIAQLGSAWVFQLAVHTDITNDARSLMADGLGQVTRISGASTLSSAEAAALANEIQRFLLEETRLGIPAVVHEEVCAGLMSRGATVFPQPIGLACSWDPSLVEQMAEVVRKEMRAVGAQQGLSPVLDVCRDPRWGRMEETFGEDQHLVAMFGNAFVRGLQGDDFATGVVATAKHFVGYGASDGGLNWAPARLPERELHDVYLHPFEAAVGQGLRSLMNAYHELDGMPCGADRDLLTGLLRETWGFDGYVVSDYFAVRQLESYHRLASNATDAARMALSSGLDVELPATDCYGRALVEAVETGAIALSDLDTSVRRVLRTKFELGLFEQPFVDVEHAASVVGSASHRELAKQLARASIVLLRNDGCLPLASHAGSIAVIGPNAHEARHLFGDYSYMAHVETLIESRDSGGGFSMSIPEDLDLNVELGATRTVFDALQERFGTQARYALGCDVNTDRRSGIAEAVALAAGSDLAILVMGDKSGLTDDCTSGESRDRSSLDLPGVQEELVRAVLATGTPVVLVLVSGRPCGSVSIHEQSAAVVAAWMPGQEGADAIADVLTGAHNPGAKLAVTFPRNVGQVPVFYRHKLSGGRSHWKGDYADGPVAPLYNFGHGLSYTRFTVTPTACTPTQVSPDGTITVQAEVTNTGRVAGDEVVQLYIRDPRASLTRPVRELKSFARVSLEPGASRTVTFTLPVAQVGFHDRTMRYVVEPGEIEVHIGTSLTDLQRAGSFTIVGEASSVEVAKMFEGTVTISNAVSDGALKPALLDPPG